MKAVCAFLAYLLVGSIALDAATGSLSVDATDPDARLGALASGSSGGPSGTDATASVAGTLLTTTTDVLYLNNTNATRVWYARLSVASSSGLANLPTLTIGIKNGTSTVAQVVASLGTLTQSTGAFVRLEPASANRIYVTRSVSTLGLGGSVALDVIAADDAAESATDATNSAITIT